MIQHLLDSMPMDEYEGRSPKEVHYLIYDPFCSNSPMSVSQNISFEILKQVPIFNLIRFYLQQIHDLDSVKLTSRGNLPTKLVRSVYAMQFIPNDIAFDEDNSNTKKSESYSVANARVISELAGLTKNRKNEVTLTQKGKKLLDIKKQSELFWEIVHAFTLKFNWSYYDDYGDNNIGQFGFAYTLDMVSRYGKVMRSFDFYSEKYRLAFGSLLFSSSKEDMRYIQDYFDQCYIVRSIERFLRWFGLIVIAEGSGPSKGEHYLLKSKVFDSLFTFD
jgi:hypothetical protein